MKGWGGEVADEEELYRRVRQTAGGQPCYQTSGDRVTFSQSAFNDPSKESSVDRAAIRPGPHQARLSSDDGIVTLQAAAIRKIATIAQMTEKGKPVRDAQGQPKHYALNI